MSSLYAKEYMKAIKLYAEDCSVKFEKYSVKSVFKEISQAILFIQSW